MEMSLQPSEEIVGIDPSYQWNLPHGAKGKPRRKIRSVWYFALPLTSAHRSGHSGYGHIIEGAGGQERYLNEGTVYPHASLIEMITYQQRCFPDITWQYTDLSHRTWSDVRAAIADHPPDVAAFTVYTATALWAFIVAAELKRVNPRTTLAQP